MMHELNLANKNILVDLVYFVEYVAAFCIEGSLVFGVCFMRKDFVSLSHLVGRQC